MLRICEICGEGKPNSEFSKHSGYKDGLRKTCKECDNKRSKSYYQKNRKRILKRRRSKMV